MSLTHSITTRLLTVVFSFYLVVAVSVTALHMVTEYYSARERISHELERYSETFSKGVLLSLWEFDQDHLRSLIEGALTIPSIIGVKVTDQSEKIVIALGEYSDSNSESLKGSLFWQKDELVYTGEEVSSPMTLGSLYLYSSNAIVLDRIYLSLLFVLVNAIIKTIALWVIFLLVGRRLLTKPLLRLRSAADSVDFTNLENSKINIQSQSRNELTGLQDSFNEMIDKLQHTKNERDKAQELLIEYNQNLQYKVDDRTKAIKDALRQQENLNKELVRRTQELNEANAKLTFLATTDSLTGLCNRSEIVRLSEQEFERSKRYQRHLTVLMLDIDYFKKINDHFGHAGGDSVLKCFAETCQAHLRVNDKMGRMGGEEFAILLPETGLGDARQLAERIRSGVASLSTPTNAGAVHITVSIGIAEVQAADNSIEDTMIKADESLYRAKGEGRNRVVCQD